MHACRLAFGRRRPVGPEGKICWPPDGAFFRALDLENNFFGSLLLSADKYIHQLRTTPQRHKGLTKRFVAVSSLAILAGYRQQRRAAAGPRFCAARVPAAARGRLWAGAVRAWGDVARAGWIAWQALVLRDQSGRDHRLTRSREVPIRKGQFFACALGPRRRSCSQAKAIRGHSRRLPGGLACKRAGSRSGAREAGQA